MLHSHSYGVRLKMGEIGQQTRFCPKCSILPSVKLRNMGKTNIVSGSIDFPSSRIFWKNHPLFSLKVKLSICGLIQNDSFSRFPSLQPSLQSAALFPPVADHQLIGKRETIQSNQIGPIPIWQIDFEWKHNRVFFLCSKFGTCSFRRICLRSLRPIPCKPK